LEADQGGAGNRPELRFMQEGNQQTGAVADAIAMKTVKSIMMKRYLQTRTF